MLWCSSLVLITDVDFFVSVSVKRPALPFILWGIWVDLPMRLKWLRLREGKCFAVVVIITSIPVTFILTWVFPLLLFKVTMTLKIS